MKRPNILYIHSHDTGRYIQPYGYGQSTPNLQKLAEMGVVFRQAYCAGPTCSASRAALLTGQSPHSSGMLGLAHRGWSLNDYSRHLIHTLREQAGYKSYLAGIQHIAEDTSVIGYDRFLSGENATRMPEDVANEFLTSAPPEPFFLSVGFGDTHRDFPGPGLLEDPRYTRPPECLPDTPETRYDMAAYHADARSLDNRMGRVLDTLKRTGLDKNTIVICTTDHGIAFPRMKCTLTDAGLGVMLILAGPEEFGGGRVLDTLVSHVDIFPTLCDSLGIERPGWLEGNSFLPALRGQAEEVNEQIFGEVTYHAAYEPQRAVRTQRYKYIRRFGDRRQVVLPNCDDSPSKDLWMAHGWGEMHQPQEALFDLVFDPNEANNLAGDPGHADALAEMRQRLDAWMQRTNDPLLKGDVAPPSGAVFNDPDGISPREPMTRAE